MNAPLPPDPYRVLGVDPTADAGAIKTAYRKLVLKCHPDKFPDPTLKARKQDEFQRVQQAYEILSEEDKRRDYDLEVKAKKLREELYRKGPSTSTATQSRYMNVNIRTADPSPGWSPSSKHSSSKSYKPYSGSTTFSQSWEHDIPSRSKAYYEEDRKARRTASYEKPKREDSRERRRRAEDERERDRQREREREDEEVRRELKRQQKLSKEREQREREQRDRDRERQRREAKRDRDEREAREKYEAKERKKRDREREIKRKPDAAEEKTRAKSKPVYVEPYSEEEEDVPRSRSKKSSAKKQSDSPSRDKTARQRDRTGPREEGHDEKYHSTLAYAALYVQATQAKGSKSPKHTPAQDGRHYTDAYPDPNEWEPPKRRGSGDGKHGKDEPSIVIEPGSPPPRERPEVINVSPTEPGRPPPLQKSHTMPPGYMPQVQPAPPTRGPLPRSYTMAPEYQSRSSAEKHRPSRRRASFDEDDAYDDRFPRAKVLSKYTISGRDKGTPRIVEQQEYKDPYAYTPGASFSKVKVAPHYGREHVAAARPYEDEEVLTSQYPHAASSYAQGAAVY